MCKEGYWCKCRSFAITWRCSFIGSKRRRRLEATHIWRFSSSVVDDRRQPGSWLQPQRSADATDQRSRRPVPYYRADHDVATPRQGGPDLCTVQRIPTARGRDVSGLFQQMKVQKQCSSLLIGIILSCCDDVISCYFLSNHYWNVFIRRHTPETSTLSYIWFHACDRIMK